MRVESRVRGSWNSGAALIVILVLSCSAACHSGDGEGDGGVIDAPGPFTLTFSLDASFQGPHGGQPIDWALVRSSNGVVVVEGDGTVSATQDPSFSLFTGAVLKKGVAYEIHYWIDSNIGGGTPGVCDPKAIDHQWSTEFRSATNDIDFTVSHDPALTEDVCDTFNP